MDKKKFKVIHLVPYDGTGGVEVAARSMTNASDADVDFLVQYVYSRVSKYTKRFATFLPLPILRAWWQLHTDKPDVIVVSLWRACIVGLLLKLTAPRVRLVLFLHSTQDMHLLDKCFTRLAAFFSSEWWGDSKTTLAQRITGCPAKSRRVISFVTRRLNSPERKALTPTFIFWGRITEVKALKRAVSILAGIRKALPNARYVIIGPDGGQLQTVKSEVTKLGLENSITFCGEMRIDQIEYEAAHASFYLQTSLHEGMAMSVVEAMQLGLVPVVTPVGEIANYARHGENALVVNDDKEAVTDVLALLNNDALYQAMRDRAVASWSGQPLYKDSMLAACRELLGIKSASCCEKKFDEKMKTAREFE